MFSLFTQTTTLSPSSIPPENDFDEEASADNQSGDQLLVTECWVEPQNGLVVSSSNEDEPGSESASDFLHGIDFDQISVSVSVYCTISEVLSSLAFIIFSLYHFIGDHFIASLPYLLRASLTCLVSPDLALLSVCSLLVSRPARLVCLSVSECCVCVCVYLNRGGEGGQVAVPSSCNSLS